MGYKFTQLTAVGNTEAITVKGNINHTFQVVVANTDTSVDYNVQGSLDGTNFFDLAASDVQQTADGTYYLTYANTPLVEVRCSFTAEAGGTAVTLDFTYEGNGQ